MSITFNGAPGAGGGQDWVKLPITGIDVPADTIRGLIEEGGYTLLLICAYGLYGCASLLIPTELVMANGSYSAYSGAGPQTGVSGGGTYNVAVVINGRVVAQGHQGNSLYGDTYLVIYGT